MVSLELKAHQTYLTQASSKNDIAGYEGNEICKKNRSNTSTNLKTFDKAHNL